MRKPYSNGIKQMALLLGLLVGVTQGVTAQWVNFDLLKNAAGTGGGVTNYPVWIQYGAPLNYTTSGVTDSTGTFQDSLPFVTTNVNVTFITYDCTGAPIVTQDTIYPSTVFLRDTAIVSCFAPPPSLQVSASASQDTANPLSFSFTGGILDSALPSNTSYTYQWDFGDGSPNSGNLNSLHTYSNPGTYTVCFTATAVDSVMGITLFSSSTCISVLAAANPVDCKSWMLALPDGGNTMQFLAPGGNPGVPPVDTFYYRWDFGDGNFSSIRHPKHSYNSSGTYQVCLNVYGVDSLQDTLCISNICSVVETGFKGSCSSFFTGEIDSGNPLQYNFYDSSTVALAPGEAPSKIWIVHESGGGGLGMSINTGFGGFNYSYEFRNPGKYQACLYVLVTDTTSGIISCAQVYCDSIEVGTPFCRASYIVDTANSFFGNVYIWNNSTPAYFSPHHANSYSWDFGDGDTSNQPFPVHTYATPGIYPVCLTVTSVDSLSNICNDTYCDTLGVDSLGNLIYKNGTIFTLTVLNPETIGIEENELEEFKMYPNPATDKVILEWESSDESMIEWRITDIKGAVLLAGEEDSRKGNKIEVDVSRLGAGVYILSASRKGNPNSHYKLRIN